MGLFGLPAASLAVLPERAVAVSWTSFVDAENPTAWVSVVTPESDGTWAEPIDLAPGAASFFPRVVVDHDELWVVYSRMDGTAPTWSIEARRYDDGWGEPETVHAAEGSPPLIAEVVATDHGIVVFTDVAEGGGAVLAHARTEAGWTTEGVGGSAVHAVAVGRSDREVALLTAVVDGEAAPQVAVRSHDGAWNEPVPLQTLPDDVEQLQVAVDVATNGTAIATWLYRTHSGDSVWVATRSTDGTWSSPHLLTEGESIDWISATSTGNGHHVAVLSNIERTANVYSLDVEAPVTPPPPPPAPVRFDDVPPNAFFTAAVDWARAEGHTTGVGGRNVFEPMRSITRAESVTLLHRIAGSPSGAPSAGFVDTPPGFYTSAVNWAAAEGITTGVGGTREFQPHRDITRAELITMLWRSAGSPTDAPDAGFDDTPRAFYTHAVNWARAEGLTTGVGGRNVFEPMRPITRAEAITMMHRLALSRPLT